MIVGSPARKGCRRDPLDRLEALKLYLPPLRERPEDAPLPLERSYAVADGRKATNGQRSGRLHLDTKRKWDDLHNLFRW